VIDRVTQKLNDENIIKHYNLLIHKDSWLMLAACS